MSGKNPKSLDFETCDRTFGPLREGGQKIVLCHGVFDLLHPGHLAHLQEAKAFGDILVVSITSAPFVNRGPGRPAFSDEMRVYALSALACVDYVLIAPAETALEVIARVKPTFYMKGQEYADAASDVTNNIDREAEEVRKNGGDIRYSGKIVFSSSKLINQHLNVMPAEVKDYAVDFVQRFSFETLRESVDAMKNLKVLVIGDAIVDEFIHSQIQGLTSKGRVISARFIEKEQHLGGSLAIARHVANFAGKVSIATAFGGEEDIRKLLTEKMPPVDLDLLVQGDGATIIKRRYIEKMGRREEYSKVFACNYIDEDCLSAVQREDFLSKLEAILPEFDLVIATDFGHGLIDARTMDLLQDKAPFLAINVQTNSANFGFNLISKYRRADVFCLDEQELRLAFSDRKGDPAPLLRKLSARLGAKAGWLTLGSAGSLGLDADEEHSTPALTLHVKDTTGAGDAFLALASLGARLRLPLPLSSVLGNLAAALTANVLGNAEPVGKPQLLKFAETVLKH